MTNERNECRSDVNIIMTMVCNGCTAVVAVEAVMSVVWQ